MDQKFLKESYRGSYKEHLMKLNEKFTDGWTDRLIDGCMHDRHNAITIALPSIINTWIHKVSLWQRENYSLSTIKHNAKIFSETSGKMTLLSMGPTQSRHVTKCDLIPPPAL